MDFIFDAIATVLAWFYELTHNYGLSIMLLTLVIMILLTPLTLKGTRSMLAPMSAIIRCGSRSRAD